MTKKSIDSTVIGVSLFLGSNATGIFNSGVQQHALFFAELLIEIGYTVYIICDNVNPENMNLVQYNEKFKFITSLDIFTCNFDIIFILGYDFIQDDMVKILKTQNTKIIFYKCGSDVTIDGEAVCFKLNRKIRHKRFYDEIWSIPQMYNMNHHYLEILYNCPVRLVPFVWSPVFIEKNEWLYEPNQETKNRVAIMEPNISIVKNALSPILICEESYKNGAPIEHVFVTNILDIKRDKNINLEELSNFTEPLSLAKDNKIHIEDRYHTLPMMKYTAQVVVSNTLMDLNSLNYLYFDLAYMGYPILHNGSLCKEVGYYYDNNELKNAGKYLCEILDNHDKTYLDYRERNRYILDQYRPNNKLLQHKYRSIISNLLL